MAVDPYNPSIPVNSTQVELSAELRALKGVNVNHRDRIVELEEVVVPITDITPYGVELVHLTSVEANLDKLGAGSAGVEVFEKDTVDEILSYLGLAGATLLVESAAGKTCVTWNTGLMLQIVNLEVGSSGTSFTWFKAFPTLVYAAIPGLNSSASQGCSVDTITTAGARADHGNVSNQQMTVWALGK